MISVGVEGIDIGNATFEVIPSWYNYARLPNTREPTRWAFEVTDSVDTVKFDIYWEEEFHRFVLKTTEPELELYIRMTDFWADKLRSLPNHYKWVSDEPMDMLLIPDGRVIPIKPIRDAVRKELVDSMQKFVDSGCIYPDCDECMDSR